jgi:hypothetical protein
LLVRSKHFITECVRLAPGAEHTPSAQDCQLWICVEGSGTMAGAPTRAGDVWLLPDSATQPVVHARTAARFLRTYVPRST